MTELPTRTINLKRLKRLHANAAAVTPRQKLPEPLYDYMRGAKIDIKSTVYPNPCPGQNLFKWMDKLEDKSSPLQSGTEYWYTQEQKTETASQQRVNPAQLQEMLLQVWPKIYRKGEMPHLNNYNVADNYLSSHVFFNPFTTKV